LEEEFVFATSHLALYGTGSSSPLAFHADMLIYIQLPKLGFQQRP
jgi:hypothetical protein